MKIMLNLLTNLGTAALIGVITFLALVGFMAINAIGLSNVIGAFLAYFCNPAFPSTCDQVGFISGMVGISIGATLWVAILMTLLWPYELPSLQEKVTRLLDRSKY